MKVLLFFISAFFIVLTSCTYVIITDSPVKIEGKVPITVGKDQ